jgi:PilZ domain
MLKTSMLRIVNIVCRRARRQGFILPQDVRAELAGAGMPETRWQEVVALAGDRLSDHDGCYFYRPEGVSSRREQLRQRRLNRAVRRLMRGYKAVDQNERRRQGRIDYIHPVQVETADGRSFTVLSCDLSVNGIRLISPTSLLGQKIRVCLPTGRGVESKCFSVQIVWSSVVGEGLCENGGAFLGIVRLTRPSPSDPAVDAESGTHSVAQAGPNPFCGRTRYPRAR